MKTRRLGTSELEVTPVVLGTWALGGWLWGGTAHNDADAAIKAALDAGINCIDTAPVYGFGLSEEVVGHAIRGRRDEVLLATKCGMIWEERPGATPFFDTVDADGRPLRTYRCLRKASIIDECNTSLARLGVDTIDLYQCHWPHDETPIDETMEALEGLRDVGKIRAFGVSNFSVAQLRDCVAHTASLASQQPKYSLLSRAVEADVLPFCLEHNIGILAYSPMEMGLLTGKVTMDREFPETDTRRNRPWFQPDKRRQVLDALATIRPIAEKHNATLGQLAVAWIIAQPGVTAAIVGARNEEQALSNAKAASLDLVPEDVAAIRGVFESLVLDEALDPAAAKR